MTVLVTGGAGFIGANFVLDWMANTDDSVVNVDKLTYAGNLKSLTSVLDDPRHKFVRADILDREAIRSVLEAGKPSAVVHFAAESHVDRSIHGPEDFVQTNAVGTFRLLDETRQYWSALPADAQKTFRFLNVSTDEVFGSLGPTDPPFDEENAYSPNSPYSASKSAADHFARAYFATFGFPVITTNCSNNYGPYQFPEKLIPLMILNAMRGKRLPVYGDGLHVRDWLYVGDHCAALRRVLECGKPGETYNIGGNCEMSNLAVVEGICTLLDELLGDEAARSHHRLIEFVKDREGHDRRYAVDAGKIERELGWKAQRSFVAGLRSTVQWYLDNPGWIADVESGDYQKWMDANYASRAGAA